MKSGNKLLLGLCALLLLALALLPAAVGAAGTEKCPKGQTGTPPYCATPSNKFKLGKVKHEGTAAKIRVTVPGPGVIKASGKYLLTTKGTAKSAGKFLLPLKLSKAGVAALKKTGTLKVKVTFVFTPTGGTPAKKRKNITFKL